MRLLVSRPSWLFGFALDCGVFTGSAFLACAAVCFARWVQWTGDTPAWLWLLWVVGVDVAHVWATLFRSYLDPVERARRSALFVGIPLGLYLAGVMAYAASPLWFWRGLAYAALFHFIRQQVGWLTLYQRRAQCTGWERRLEVATIYAVTVGPVLWWHAQLPRPYAWLMEGDFLPGLPPVVGTCALAISAALGVSWLGSQALRVVRGEGVEPGKALLILSTALTWTWGIVFAPDDLTFTVMNVLPHGVPYVALLWRYAQGRATEPGAPFLSSWVRRGLVSFVLLLVLLALLEEGLWDQLVWHERAGFFGPSLWSPPETLLALLVPLLALPQATHYVLDAFLWRTRGDPTLKERLGWGALLSVHSKGNLST